MTDMSRLRVCLFSGASSLPIRMADHLGLLPAVGLSAELHLTRGSKQLVEGLLAGRYDVVHAAPDNFIEWSDRTGADIVSWIGGTSGPLQLIGSPELEGVGDLARRGIAVDSPESGFVSILMKILAAGGLRAEDVSLVPLGSTQLRYEALMAGRTAATMLALPWSAMALEAGFSVLGDRDQALPGMQGSCGASLGTWLDTHPDTADAYLKALCAAITWLNHPENSVEANRYICDTYGTTPTLAEAVRRSIMDPRTGWSPSAFIDPVGMEMVCRLRTENGRPPDGPPASYYSLEPYRRVFGFGLRPCAGEPPGDVESA